MNKEQLQNIFKQSFSYETWQSVLINLFGATKLYKKPTMLDSDSNEKVQGYQLGLLNTTDRYSIGLFCFEINGNTNIKLNRVGLRSLVHSYIKYKYDAAIVVYYDNSHWRLSFICDLKDEKTTPKRFTYVLGNSEETYHTAAAQLSSINSKEPSFKSIKEAFSVEKLSKDFFGGYKARYEKFCNAIGGTEKWQRDYVKKMMGRLVFLQFLQKKGWMGVPIDSKDWIGGDLQYMQHLIQRYEGNNRLLSDILEPLFFDTLNTKRTSDVVDSILGNNIKIPYLNGGLFDKDSIDEENIDFPYDYFADLMDFFSQYNFTIDENDPDDTEVGIDPEMLGHIFENLLEDNKNKGAFYTPKEIVQYMSRESIVQYLKTYTADNLHDAIEQLIKNGKIPDVLQSKTTANEVYNLLKRIKVCDPAIGSGAFPMGILNALYRSRQLLYGFTQDKDDFSPATIKREIIKNNIFGVDIEQGAVDIARLRFWLALVVDEVKPQPLPNLDYKIMCGNSLLSHHSLDVPINDVFAEYSRKNQISFTLTDYQKLVTDYTNTSDHTLKDKFKEKISDIKSAFKTVLNNDIIKRRQKIEGQILTLESDTIFGPPAKENLKKAKELRKNYAKLLNTKDNVERDRLYADAFEWRFEFPALLDDNGDFEGFDIVIGNPPYLRVQGIRDSNSAFAEELVSKYRSATGSFDLYAIFAERGLQIIKKKGLINYIMPVKWTNAAFGKGLRDVVTENNSACKIINFGAYQVFNASTYTALQWFKPNSNEILYYELDCNLETNQNLGEYLNSLNSNNATKINADKLSKETWILTVGPTTDVLNKLDQQPRRIADIFDKIFCGLQTSKDDVYFLYECTEMDGFVTGLSKYLDRRVSIERGLVKPLLKGDDIHRYDNISTNRYVIFPYKIENGKANLFSETEISALYPQGYDYLKRCEGELRGRENSRLINDDFWYRYIYPKNLTMFEHEKLVAPHLSYGGQFAWDKKGFFYGVTNIYGYIKKTNIKEKYDFWLGLFNSKLFWFFIQNTGAVMRGGHYLFKPGYINPFPIPGIIPPETEKAITTIVDYILFIKSLPISKQVNEYVNNNVIVRLFENVIDALVYELYFNKEFSEANISFANYVVRDFKNIENSDIIQSILIIESSYQKLREIDNEIRNNIKCMAIKMEKLLAPIINM